MKTSQGRTASTQGVDGFCADQLREKGRRRRGWEDPSSLCS